MAQLTSISQGRARLVTRPRRVIGQVLEKLSYVTMWFAMHVASTPFREPSVGRGLFVNFRRRPHSVFTINFLCYW